jgi:hypothetical protein
MPNDSEERILRQRVFEVQGLVDKALQKHFGCRLWKLKKPVDQLRLVVFQLWAEKYHTSVDEVVEIVVTYFRRLMSKKLRHAPIFGATIATVTGQHAEKILQDTLLKRNSDRERDWLQSERDRQLRLLVAKPVDQLHASAENSFLKNYSKTVKQGQVQSKSKELLTRRRFRGTPW